MDVLSKDKHAPLWMGYLRAGEAAQRKKQNDLAKRYFLGAWSELERSGAHPHGLGVAAMLEQDLASIYCVDLSKAKGDQHDKLKLREEQVSILGRINRFNQAHHATQIVQDQYQRMYDEASKALEREKAGAPVGEGENKTFVFPHFQ